MKLETQLYIGNKPNEAEMVPITNETMPSNKPIGGLWTSTYIEEIGSSWFQFGRSIGWYEGDEIKSWLLIPQEANLFVIDCYEDLERLVETYSEPFELPFKTLRRYDFESMSNDYDGIHLTAKGQDETRLTMPYNMYGWDCECTLWFRWKFDQVIRMEDKTVRPKVVEAMNRAITKYDQALRNLKD